MGRRLIALTVAFGLIPAACSGVNDADISTDTSVPATTITIPDATVTYEGDSGNPRNCPPDLEKQLAEHAHWLEINRAFGQAVAAVEKLDIRDVEIAKGDIYFPGHWAQVRPAGYLPRFAPFIDCEHSIAIFIVTVTGPIFWAEDLRLTNERVVEAFEAIIAEIRARPLIRELDQIGFFFFHHGDADMRRAVLSVDELLALAPNGRLQMTMDIFYGEYSRQIEYYLKPVS